MLHKQTKKAMISARHKNDISRDYCLYKTGTYVMSQELEGLKII